MYSLEQPSTMFRVRNDYRQPGGTDHERARPACWPWPYPGKDRRLVIVLRLKKTGGRARSFAVWSRSRSAVVQLYLPRPTLG